MEYGLFPIYKNITDLHQRKNVDKLQVFSRQHKIDTDNYIKSVKLIK